MLPTIVDASRTEYGNIFVTLVVTDSPAGMADGIFQFTIASWNAAGVRIRKGF